MLIINDNECSDPKRIASETYSFYILTRRSISPQINEDFRNDCEAEISYRDQDKTIQCLTSDCSHGADGLTANFYKHFCEHIKVVLFETLKETIENVTTIITKN